MPTTKPRYTLTDTGVVAESLDRAAERWPEVGDRRELLVRLMEAGAAAIGRDAEDWERRVRETAGTLTGVYRPDELERLREDWPA